MRDDDGPSRFEQECFKHHHYGSIMDGLFCPPDAVDHWKAVACAADWTHFLSSESRNEPVISTLNTAKGNTKVTFELTTHTYNCNVSIMNPYFT